MDKYLELFDYGHLPPHLQEASRPFYEIAQSLVHASCVSGQQIAMRQIAGLATALLSMPYHWQRQVAVTKLAGLFLERIGGLRMPGDSHDLQLLLEAKDAAVRAVVAEAKS